MSRRMLGQAAGLFAAGAVVGGIVAGTVGASASPRATSPSPSPRYGGGYAAGPGFAGHHGMRGFGLPQSGAVTAVGSSSVTIRTTGGTKTYAVDGHSDIDKNGEAKLSDLVAGDKVRFGLRPGSSTIAVLHAGDEAKNLPPAGARPGFGGPGGPGGAGRHGGRGHCDGDGQAGSGGPAGSGGVAPGTQSPKPTATTSTSSNT